MINSASWKDRFIFLIATLWTCYTLAYLNNLFFYLGIFVYPTAHRAINVCLITLLVFLTCPAKKGGRFAWYDGLAILLVLLGCGYIVLYSDHLIYAWGDTSFFQVILGTGIIICLLEAIRRTGGNALLFIIIFFVLYTIFSNYFPGFLRSSGFSYSMTIGWMYLSGEGIWGTVIGVVSTLVAGFVIFGSFFRSTGASNFFIDLALSVVGTVRGGPAKTAVVASGLMGMISGSVVANVAATGTVTIPLMKKHGYKNEFAGAVEACSSTGGMFTPPVMGAVAFLIAEFLNVSYWFVIVAAALPAFLYYFVLLNQVDLEAVRLGLKGMPKENMPSLRRTLYEGWHFLLPIGVLIIFLGILSYSAETSLMVTLWCLIVVSSFKKVSRLNRKRVYEALEESAKGMINIIPLCAGIGIIVGSLIITGAGINLSSKLLHISGGSKLLLLIMAAGANFILGMGMTAVTCYIITVILMAPALIKLGVEPIAAHMFLFYYGTISFITPPVAIGAYVAASIADGDPWETGWRATLLGSAAFIIPWSFVYNPALLGVGTVIVIIEVSLFCIFGGLCVSVAIVGLFWFKKSRLRIWERILVGLAGLVLLGPISHMTTNLLALAVACIITFKNFWSSPVIREKRLK